MAAKSKTAAKKTAAIKTSPRKPAALKASTQEPAPAPSFALPKKLSGETRAELIFLAQETSNAVRSLKNLSHAVLAVYAAAFAFVWNTPDTAPFFLFWMFNFFGIVVIYLCVDFVPDKLSKQRNRLHDIFNSFTPVFKEAYGDIGTICKANKGDKVYALFALFFPLALILANAAHKKLLFCT